MRQDVDNIEPMAHPQDAMQRLRDDVVTETNQREKLMGNCTIDGSGFVP